MQQNKTSEVDRREEKMQQRKTFISAGPETSGTGSILMISIGIDLEKFDAQVMGDPVNAVFPRP